MPQTFDPREVFAALVEKERIKGHHSPEGRTMRTLSRALNGWFTQTLSNRDVVVVCDQAVEDWLRGRMTGSPWPDGSAAALIRQALTADWIDSDEAERLAQLHGARLAEGPVSDAQAVAALEFCVELIDKRW